MCNTNKSKPIATIVASKCYETFGMHVVESNSFGIPVISSNTGNLSKLVIDGVTGIHFDIHDANSLIEAVKRFENLDFVQVANNARQEYKRKYTDKKNYLLLNDIYIKAQT